MRNKHIFSLIVLLFLCTRLAIAATYYVAPNGSDSSTRDGSASQPWATLSYACSRVTTAGNIIHLNAGTYNETRTSSLAIGVSLEGPTASPPTAIVRGWSGANPVLHLTSGSITNGNQEVRYVHFQGAAGYATNELMKVEHRHNVKVHHCRFSGADDVALSIAGYRTGTKAGTLATGIEVYNNTFEDSSKDQGGWASGCLQIGYTDGAKIYNNVINNETRPGHGIKYWDSEGHNFGLMIYSNEIHVQQDAGGAFVFAIEMWDIRNGSRIYDNQIEGEINVDEVSFVSPATFGLEICGNTIYRDTLTTSGLDDSVSFDDNCNGVLIHDNCIYNKHNGVNMYLTGSVTMQNFKIYRNVMYNMGRSGGTNGRFMSINPQGSGDIVRNLYIWNNIFDGTGGRVGSGLDYEVAGATFSGLEIINNVFIGCVNRWLIWWGSGSWTGVILRNNDRYNNANSNNYTNNNGIAKISTESGNIIVSPGITASGNRPSPYYQPSGAGSNLVDKGVNVGLPFQGAAPDIGAYEYAGVVPPPPQKPASPRNLRFTNP